jgi:CubicO group peptidase (beta-lactamase class C family)
MLRRIVLFAALGIPLSAQLADSSKSAIDQAVHDVLAATDGPSVSVAITQNGQIVLAQSYGQSRLDPATSAQPGMRYKIGSNTKQFTAAAILLLAEEGKISLDDPVSRFFPDLTRAQEITVRQLLSHTSGYQDYYAIDYVAPWMALPVTHQGILDRWAKKPLDFDPGAKWEYSNTNYVIAGAIVEKISGRPLTDFLRERFFTRLGMTSPIDADRVPWSAGDATGYNRYALGPLRPAKPEGAGWLFAAGQLAMTASDLARWDIALMNGTLLKAASIAALTAEVKLKNGSGTGYALGLGVSPRDGHRQWAHTGGTAGFFSSNMMLPDERISITVLSNGETPAHREAAARIRDILVPSTLEISRRLFRGLQQGKLDRSLLTPDANAYFTAQAVSDFASSLGPLGEIKEFRQTGSIQRGGMTERTFSIKTAAKSLSLSTYWTPDGRIDQYLVSLAPE